MKITLAHLNVLVMLGCGVRIRGFGEGVSGCSVLRLLDARSLSSVFFITKRQRHCEALLVSWTLLIRQAVLVGNLKC